MKYARYPKYKPSSVEWLGDLPTRWNMKRLKLNVQLGNEKGAIDDENPLPFVGLENVESWTGKLLFNEDQSVSEGISNFFRSGDTLFGKLRPYLAKACNVDFDGFCSSDLLVMKEQKLNRKYLLYTLLSEGFIGLVDSSSYGVKMPRASWDFIGSIRMPVPSDQEQNAIASFLDRETAKIDALVAKRRKLIEKLKEKRTALISRTVTRGLPPVAAKAAGLNPHPKLKPSGVEWLGEIPEHWEVKMLKRIASLKSGENIVSEELKSQDEYPVYGGNGLRGYATSFTHDGHYVLIGRQGALCGNINYATGKFWASEHAIVVTPTTELEVIWLGELLRMMDLNQYSISAAQPGLSIENVSKLRIPVAPFFEQRAIAGYLNNETTKIDQMVEKVEAAIEKLQEYRTALITAAVTGKIDVRKAS